MEELARRVISKVEKARRSASTAGRTSPNARRVSTGPAGADSAFPCRAAKRPGSGFTGEPVVAMWSHLREMRRVRGSLSC